MKKITLILLFFTIVVIPTLFGQTKREEMILPVQHNLGIQNLFIRLPQINSLTSLDSLVFHNSAGKRIAKEEYSFDTEGNLTLMTGYLWDIESWTSTQEQWLSRYKAEILYDEAGRDTSTISYSMAIDGTTGKEEWSPLLKETSKYDENGFLIQKLSYNYSPYPEEKPILYKTENVETRTDSESQTTWQIFKAGNDSSAIRYEYDQDERISLITKCVRSIIIDKPWTDAQAESYTYDEQSRAIEFTVQNPTGDSIDPYAQKLVIKYDDQSKPVSADLFGTTTSVKIWSSKRIGYLIPYYQKQSTGLNKINQADINVWSNGQFIYIESETNLAYIRIYSLSGNLLYQDTSKGNTSIIPSPVRHGIFLVNVTDVNGKSKTEKIRIQ